MRESKFRITVNDSVFSTKVPDYIGGFYLPDVLFYNLSAI